MGECLSRWSSVTALLPVRQLGHRHLLSRRPRWALGVPWSEKPHRQPHHAGGHRSPGESRPRTYAYTWCPVSHVSMPLTQHGGAPRLAGSPVQHPHGHVSACCLQLPALPWSASLPSVSLTPTWSCWFSRPRVSARLPPWGAPTPLPISQDSAATTTRTCPGSKAIVNVSCARTPAVLVGM